jgi:hypothetical protein
MARGPIPDYHAPIGAGGRMTSFEFFTVLLSFVVSLGVAGLLQSVVRLVQEAPRVKFSLTWALWAGAIFSLQIIYWLKSWTYHEHFTLRIETSIPPLVLAIVAFMACGPTNTEIRGVVRYDLARGSTQRYRVPEGDQNSEPVFVSRPNASSEDDGWLLICVYRRATDTSDLVILDGGNVEGEPIATVHLPRRIPAGFHGAWLQKDRVGRVTAVSTADLACNSPWSAAADSSLT